MSFKKTNEVSSESVNISFISNDEYDAGKVDILSPSLGATIEKRKIMYADPNGVLFDWNTGNKIIEVSNPYITDLFKDKDLDYIVDNSEVFEQNALLYKYDCYKPYYGDPIVNSVDYYFDDNSKIIATKFNKTNVTGLVPITLEYDNGDLYTGEYEILIQRCYPEQVEVNSVDSEYSLTSNEGMTLYYVTVLLSENVSNVYIKYTTAEIGLKVGTSADYYPMNINSRYKEKIVPKDIFSYVDVETVETSNEDYLAASIDTGNGYKIQTNDKAIIDPRELDFFFWRVKGKIQSYTSTIESNREVVNIGVIGGIGPEFSEFLTGDSAYSLKYIFKNPHPGSSQFMVKTDITAQELNAYDIIIYRSSVVDWKTWGARLTEFTNNNGTLLIDFNNTMPRVIDSTLSSLKLNLTFNAPISTGTQEPYIMVAGQYLRNNPSNYILTNEELSQINANVPTVNIPLTKALIVNEDRRVVFGRVRTNTLQNGGIFLSTLGLTYKQTTGLNIREQLFINFISENIKVDVDSTYTSNKIPQDWELTSPWTYSFTAGKNEDGSSVLSETELDKYNFIKLIDGSGSLIYKRILSTKTAEQLIRDYIVKAGLEQKLYNCSIEDLSIEIKSDTSYVTGDINENGFPCAYSSRVNELFNIPDSYRMIEFDDSASSTTGIVNSPRRFTDVRVMLSAIREKKFVFDFGFRANVNKKVTTTTTKKETITKDSPYFKDVFVDTDSKWQTVYGAYKDTDPKEYSDTNLKGWSITNAKWYPYDGHAWYIHNGSKGEAVKYYQTALNELYRLKRLVPPGSSATVRNMPLEVNGVFNTKTWQAIYDYQEAWGILKDGVIDAGTAGHIMRNFGAVVAANPSYNNIYSTIWNNFGSKYNLIDNKDTTMYGKRTWFNTKVELMEDAITIKLKEPMNINRVILEPYSTNNRAIHLTSIEYLNNGRWGKWVSRKYSEAVRLFSQQTYDWGLAKAPTNEVRIKFYQDESIDKSSAKSKMWAFKNVIFEGEVLSFSTTLETVTVEQSFASVELDYMTPRVISFTPEQITAMGINFDSFNTTTFDLADIEEYVLNSIEPVTVLEEAAVATLYTGISENSTIITLNEDIYEIISCTKTSTGAQVDITKLSFAGNIVTALNGSGIAVGDSVEITYKPLVDIEVDVTLNSNGRVDVKFTQTEIVEDGGTDARYGAIWRASADENDQIVYGPAFFPNTFTEVELTDLKFRVVSVGDPTLVGVFYDRLEKKIFTSLNSSEYFGRKKNLILAVVSTKLIDQDTQVLGSTTYPRRYACKPFCIAWDFGEKTFGTRGLTGYQPFSPWYLRVNSGIITNDILIDSSLDEENQNNKVKAVYNIGSNSYSTSLKYPYIDVEEEVVDIISVDTVSINNFPVYNNNELSITEEPLTKINQKLIITQYDKRFPLKEVTLLEKEDGDISGTSWTTVSTNDYVVMPITGEIWLNDIPAANDSFRVTGKILKNFPQLELKSYALEGNPLVKTLKETLVVNWVNNKNGFVKFTSPADYDYVNQTDRWIEADYTYKEEFIPYTGYADATHFYPFDACPYDGHYIYNDLINERVKTINQLDKKIYIYVTPEKVYGAAAAPITISDPGLKHTFNANIFDKDSIEYNPYALLIATVIMSQNGDRLISSMIDTRTGGGGFLDEDKSSVLTELEDEAIWDFKQFDGDSYFIGGSVIIKLPLSWKNTWITRFTEYESLSTIEAEYRVEMWAQELAKKYGAAGKHFYIEWDENL